MTALGRLVFATLVVVVLVLLWIVLSNLGIEDAIRAQWEKI